MLPWDRRDVEVVECHGDLHVFDGLLALRVQDVNVRTTKDAFLCIDGGVGAACVGGDSILLIRSGLTFGKVVLDRLVDGIGIDAHREVVEVVQVNVLDWIGHAVRVWNCSSGISESGGREHVQVCEVYFFFFLVF